MEGDYWFKLGNRKIIDQTWENHEDQKIKMQILDNDGKVIHESYCIPCTITTIYEEDEEDE